MSRRLLLLALLALALVQVAVPLRMIASRQRVLDSGELFRFRAGPVDPYDAFRGRYVALALVDDTVATAAVREFLGGQTAFVRLTTDERGFARPAGIQRRRPAEGAFVKVTVSGHAGRRELRVRYPFDRYYMNETLAPAAEQVYRERAGGAAGDAWVAVRILDGFAVIEELYIGDRPIGEVLAGR